MAAVCADLVRAEIPGAWVSFEVPLARGARADILVSYASGERLVIECKRRTVKWSDARQAARYLDAARARWPRSLVRVALVGEAVDPVMPPERSDLWYAAVSV